MISLLPITNDDRRRVLSLGANVPQETAELVPAPVGVGVPLEELDGQSRRHEQEAAGWCGGGRGGGDYARESHHWSIF